MKKSAQPGFVKFHKDFVKNKGMPPGGGGGCSEIGGGRSGGTLRIRPGGPKNPGWTMSDDIFILSGRRLEA